MKRLPPLVIGAVAIVVGLLALFALGLAVAGQQGRCQVMPKPFWRQASNTVTATALDRFRLR